MQLNTHNWP